MPSASGIAKVGEGRRKERKEYILACTENLINSDFHWRSFIQTGNLIMTEDELSNIIIGFAIKVHKELGPGLLESAYEHCLVYELRKSGLSVERQRRLPLIYGEIRLGCIYKLDIIVEDKVVVEVKSIREITEIDCRQTLTHLKFSNTKLGLLINFNVLLLKQGIKRIVNNL